METDDLTEVDIAESIMNADAVYKKVRSTSPLRTRRREYLYVIQSTNLDGLVIYTKGKLVEAAGVETLLSGFLEGSYIEENMARIKLTVCPNCYSKNLKKVRRTVSGTRQGRRYSVPGVEFYECPDCGERIYDPTAMRQIEQASHAGFKNRSAKRIA
jgi:YgiT-type zinc finger domain-containing protein